MRRAERPWARTLGLALLAGCGYRAGLDLEGEGIRTVGVEIVANDSFRQRLELPLTRRIQRELEARTDVLTAPPRRADALLRVRIRSAREYPFAEGADDVVAVGSLVVTVDGELVRRRTGEVLRRARLADRAEFILPAGESYEEAADEAAAKLARRVVLLLDPAIVTLMAWPGGEALPTGKGEAGGAPGGGKAPPDEPEKR